MKKTDTIMITWDGQGVDKALALTEKLAVAQGLEKKQTLHLRLLCEELTGMLRGIAGEVQADYWLENEDKKFELHLNADVYLTEPMREKLLAASSDGKNFAAKGFMGKIRVIIGDILMSSKEVLPYTTVNAVPVFPSVAIAGENAAVWSMMLYRKELYKHAKVSQEAAQAWDELEKSIVANIADDVKVKIIGNNVEIIVYKSF